MDGKMFDRISLDNLPKSENKFLNVNVKEMDINSPEGRVMIENVRRSSFDEDKDIFKYWKLNKIFVFQNQQFHNEFNDKKKELMDTYALAEYHDTHYGFLTTINEHMIEKLSKFGLEVKFCPYNYLGYNIAGVHISQHVDIALMESWEKVDDDNEVLLVVFKYMLGKSKFVPINEFKTLLAPTPKFDSHICEENIDVSDTCFQQYIRSLIYLYEFKNKIYDPVERPRHCCPVAVLSLKKSDISSRIEMYNTKDICKTNDVSEFIRPAQINSTSASPWSFVNNPSDPRYSIHSLTYPPNMSVYQRSTPDIVPLLGDNLNNDDRWLNKSKSPPNSKSWGPQRLLSGLMDQDIRTNPVSVRGRFTSIRDKNFRGPIQTTIGGFNTQNISRERDQNRDFSRDRIRDRSPDRSPNRDRSPIDNMRFVRPNTYYGYGSNNNNNNNSNSTNNYNNSYTRKEYFNKQPWYR